MLNEEGKDKIGEDVEKIENTIKEIVGWIDSNPNADAEEYKTKKRDLEELCTPIISNLYQNKQAAGPPTPPPEATAHSNQPGESGPKIEELD